MVNHWQVVGIDLCILNATGVFARPITIGASFSDPPALATKKTEFSAYFSLFREPLGVK